MRHSRLLLVFTVLLMLLQGGALNGALAQSASQVWSEPVNLSRSGAADQPRIVAAPGGRLQAFWWDRFDGLTTARLEGGAWSKPSPAPIQITKQAGSQTVVTTVATMPTIVADARGRAHAFWWGEVNKATGAEPLMHSQMPIGSTSWSEPDVAADSAVAFDVSAAPGGELTLAYVRTVQDAAFPAGVYVRRTDAGEAGWRPAVGVYQTIYFRLLTAQNAYVRVADSQNGVIHLAWDDPRSRQAFYARSTVGGATWSAPETLGPPDQLPARPRVFPLPGGDGLRLWEAAGMGGCVLYQQSLTATAASSPTWGAPQRVFEKLSPCPTADRAWAQDQGLLWLWGEGTGALTLAAWNIEKSQWSEPRSLDVRFQDPESGNWVGLGDLHAALSGDALAVVGSDPTSGDVWVTVSQIGALELAFAPPSPWSEPARLSQEGAEAKYPSVAVDASGNMHVAWSQSPTGDGPGTALFYARWDAPTERWSRAVELQRGASGTEMARQPALLADAGGLIHLVWSSGEEGQIAYSRAKVGEATSSGGWSTPHSLSAPGSSASWAQIGADGQGRLVVLYAAPLNEGRGIYLVRSEDGGATWSDPTVVFDAAAVGWAMVDHPALGVAPDGALHAAWVRGALPGTWPPQGIAYARSDDGDNSWTKPEEVAGAGYDWPQLAVAGGQVHLLYAATGGGVWHRSSDNGQAGNGNGWKAAARVRGWERVAGPFGLAVSGPPGDPGLTLHLVGTDAAMGALRYSAWDGAEWSSTEVVPLGLEARTGLGAAAAAPVQGGRLAVALLATAGGEGEEAAPAVFGAARAIPTVDVSLLPTPAATPTRAVAVTPTPKPTVIPSPTPDLRTPTGSIAPVSPMLLGGGLAAVIVVGMLAVWGVRRQRGRA